MRPTRVVRVCTDCSLAIESSHIEHRICNGPSGFQVSYQQPSATWRLRGLGALQTYSNTFSYVQTHAIASKQLSSYPLVLS